MSALARAFDRVVELFKGRGYRAYASTLPGFYGRFGEPKGIEQERLLELAEGDADVRACLDAVVDAVTANGWVIESGDDGVRGFVENWLREREDEFWLFLRNLTLTALIFDEAYIECTGDFPRVVAPWTMRVIRDEYGEVKGYVQHTARIVNFSPDEIVHIVLHPLADRAYGSPKIATLSRILLAKKEAELFLFQVFMRKGVLSKAIIIKHGDSKTFSKIKNQLETSRPGDNLLLMGDVEIVELGRPIEELKILEMLSEFRQRILAVFRVPPIVFGLTESVNLETSRNQMVSFAQYVKSLQRIIGAGVSKALRRILGITGFSFRLVEWMNPEQETRLHAIRIDSGIETINEARLAMGLPPIEGEEIAEKPLPKFVFKQQLQLEESLAELMAQSRRAYPEKSRT